MARKVVMTGMLMFVLKGSLVQVVAALMVSVGFLLSIAILQPLKSPVANMFKVGAELALLVTLMIVVLLKIDLAREGVDDPEWWMSALGSILVSVNTLIPSAGLGIGLLLGRFDFEGVAADAPDLDKDVQVGKKGKDKKNKKNKKEPVREYANPVHSDPDDEAKD